MVAPTTESESSQNRLIQVMCLMTEPSSSNGKEEKNTAQAVHRQYAIQELPRDSRQRSRVATLIILLTLCAAWTSMLTYLFAGHVFASILSGNILNIGFALSQSNYPLLVRTVVAILVNIVGSAIGSVILSRGSSRKDLRSWRLIITRTLLIEWGLLLVFTLLLLTTVKLSQNFDAQILLLSLAALAMGVQGAVVFSFQFLGVVANALTGVVIAVGQGVGEDIDRSTEKIWKWQNPFRAGLILLYVLVAVVVGLTSTAFLTQSAALITATIAIVYTLAAFKQ
jgi:uncharacterized membrane protein YoaK (UPF0700 family)